MLVLDPAAEPGDTAEGIYPRLYASMLVLDAGDSVKVSAEGTSEVPAFEVTLEVPSPLRNSSATVRPRGGPDNAFLGMNGLGFSWTPAEGNVLVRFSHGMYGFNPVDPSFNATASCVYPASAGSAGLSASVIARTGCASYTATSLNAYSEQQVNAGDYAVTVQFLHQSLGGFLNCVDE